MGISEATQTTSGVLNGIVDNLFFFKEWSRVTLLIVIFMLFIIFYLFKILNDEKLQRRYLG